MNCITCVETSNLEYTVLVCGENCHNQPIATNQIPNIDAILLNSGALQGNVLSINFVTDPNTRLISVGHAILYTSNSEIPTIVNRAHVVSILILDNGTLQGTIEYTPSSSNTETNEETDSLLIDSSDPDFDRSTERPSSSESLLASSDDHVVPNVLHQLDAASPFSELGDA